MWLTILLLLTAPTPVVLPVHFHVAPADGGEGRAVDAGWIATQVAQVNAIFEPHGVQIVDAGQGPLAERYAVADDRRDRNALGPLLKPKVVNVFVVRSLRDVHDPRLYRQGVHWRPFGRAPGPRGHVRHQVILSAQAGPTVLAHELGHFLGHPAHTRTQGNLMSYNRGDGLPTLTSTQGKRMARTARRFVRSGELAPASLLSKPAR